MDNSSPNDFKKDQRNNWLLPRKSKSFPGNRPRNSRNIVVSIKIETTIECNKIMYSTINTSPDNIIRNYRAKWRLIFI